MSIRDVLSVRALFLLGVGVPTILSAIYFGLIATDRYVSEAEYVVRGVSANRAIGLESLFRTFGLSRALDDSNAVESYLESRDAVRALEAKLPLRAYFSKKNVDFIAKFPRFWAGDTFEDLYDYYLDRVSVVQNLNKGITTIRVEAFDPVEAQAIATALLALGERRVNEMNARIHDDAIKFAQADVELAEKRLGQAQEDLTTFRTAQMLIDPASNTRSVLETITSLSADLADTRARIAVTAKDTPNNPSAAGLQSRKEAYDATISEERSKLTGGAESLAPRIGAYERLALMRQLAEKGLSAAAAALETARQDARRQQIYVDEIVLPNLPDKAEEPERLRMIATVFVLSFALTSVAWLLMAGSKEHAVE